MGIPAPVIANVQCSKPVVNHTVTAASYMHATAALCVHATAQAELHLHVVCDNQPEDYFADALTMPGYLPVAVAWVLVVEASEHSW